MEESQEQVACCKAILTTRSDVTALLMLTIPFVHFAATKGHVGLRSIAQRTLEKISQHDASLAEFVENIDAISKLLAEAKD